MHKNQPGLYRNDLSGHASLLLSATPTIISSHINNNTQNPQNQQHAPGPVELGRRHPSTPLLATSNLDNDTRPNCDSPTNSTLSEGYINFKKPQNEIFKKLDGKIQRIVAAHSSFNKLYALNDFSSLGIGPKRPFELPAQLPPPPPWVPKVNTELDEHWVADVHGHSESPNPTTSSQSSDIRPGSSLLDIAMNCSNTNSRPLSDPANQSNSQTNSSRTSLTIDSAITKLHQRMKQRQQLPDHQSTGDSKRGDQSQVAERKLQAAHNNTSRLIPNNPSHSTCNIQKMDRLPQSSVSTSMRSPSKTITPAQFQFLAQKIRETIETKGRQARPTQNLPSTPDKKKLQEELVNMFKKEIFAVTKSAKLEFNTSPETKNRIADHRTTLLKSSPTTLFNTIRRETSLLLNKRDPSIRRCLDLGQDQSFRPNSHENHLLNIRPQPTTKLAHTVKVIVPPSEVCVNMKLERSSTGDMVTPGEHSESVPTLNRPALTYQVIRRKIALFQENYNVVLGFYKKSGSGLSLVQHSRGIKRPRSEKSLDKIVDRLAKKSSQPPSESSSPVLNISAKTPSIQQQLISTSMSLLQASRGGQISAPTPIPVFRSPLLNNSKGAIVHPGSSKLVNLKSKKSKRHHNFGLKLGSYIDKDQQPTLDKITVEQFARCLNLVRTNDASLRRHREQLVQAESRLKLPNSNRPLRLRRLKTGERIHMPASASYRASRKAGLQ